ncbi:MAG: SUMF1/EgtB/PvdO family nonheme iron enzyme [Planctomycetota bacterium]|jgi:formylglycine-generating enzyme required for sulfatase activity
MNVRVIGVVLVSILVASETFGVRFQSGRELPEQRQYVNSLGMRFVRIEPGTFMMGHDGTAVPEALIADMAYPSKAYLMKKYPKADANGFWVNLDNLRHGDFDEQPQHKVTISKPFYMGVHEVTNAQYELFDPGHRGLRGKNGFSREDDEAVVFVNWYQAQGFCDWLSDKEQLGYRLATEAEWEYACRAGTTTLFHTGNTLPEAFRKYENRVSSFRENEDVNLPVGQSPANVWGLFDMHGNVEEWCLDWYGPYEGGDQVDPVGRVAGDFKVTRGGSHSTEAYYLRSANRMGTLPDDRHMLIGFRVVLGELPATQPLPEPPPQRYQRNVKQAAPADLHEGPDPGTPYFSGPRLFVKMPPGDRGPLFAHHNHFMSITDCPNGDLLAAWHTCVNEKGRELAIACSRLRYGRNEWERASVFWDGPDRNDHGHALWYDADATIYHFNGLGVTARSVALVMRTSRDNGATWSRARLIGPEHGPRHQMPVESVFRTSKGHYLLTTDSGGGSGIWLSRDQGLRWFKGGGHEEGRRIRGSHAGVVEVDRGWLTALGRSSAIDGKMPMSISADMGRTWTSCAAPFEPIGAGQRLVFLRLKEGPLLMASFADALEITDASGRKRVVSGLYSAVSVDEGRTWPYTRLISDDGTGRPLETWGGGIISLDADNAETRGYLSVCQAVDGVIHLISSRQHYAFNLKWLTTVPPATPRLPIRRRLPGRQKLMNTFQPPTSPTTGAASPWRFVGRGKKGDIKLSRWSNNGNKRFNDQIDPRKGYTAEIALRVQCEDDPNHGVDFEIFNRTGNLTINRYIIVVTGASVYCRQVDRRRDQGLVKLAGELDNSSDTHVWRMAVREDTAVQIYRDNRLLGVMAMGNAGGWRTPGRGSFIEWGQRSAQTVMVVSHVAYDLTGAYQGGD